MAWKNDQVGQEETGKILELAKRCLKVSGDFVEMGCYKGDTSLLLAEVLRDYNKSISTEETVEEAVEEVVENPVGNPVGKMSISGGNSKKRLWIYDSFEGLPEKTGADKSVLGILFRGGELSVTKREVKERFLRAGLPVPVIKKGWFSELSDSDMPELVAFAFLDGDFYESIRDSLKLVVPKMNQKGIIVVHDYTNPALPGVKKAVDELLDGQKSKKSVARIIKL